MKTTDFKTSASTFNEQFELKNGVHILDIFSYLW